MKLACLLTDSMEEVLLEQLTVSQLVKKIPRIFMKHEGSLPHSQVPATCP
jgi:hypothetical protein